MAMCMQISVGNHKGMFGQSCKECRLSNKIELCCLFKLSEIKISNKEIYMILIWKIEGYDMMSQRLVSGQLLTSKLVSQTENRPIVLVFPNLQIKVYTLHIKI